MSGRAGTCTAAANGAASIEGRYRAMTPGSAERARTAKRFLPSGVVHDSRHLLPYSIYVERAKGAHKWDVDGNDYIDYFGGHGSLILGHAHPGITAAARAALDRGTHFAANHDAELRWARHVVDMVPCADKVRFTASGTEAVAMAVRLARAETGRRRILRFRGQFHGWSDDQVTGYASHFDGGTPAGIPEQTAANVVLAEADDVDALRGILAAHDDLAAVIVEPLGAATGMVPIEPRFLEALRALTAKYGQVLIFDEVVTGFRVAPGGVQAVFGITPDLTVLAKILAGGFPGGAVAGRADLLDWLDHTVSQRQGHEKVYHPGTYNANPISAAAGAAALSIIAGGGVCERAGATAARLRQGLAEVAARRGVGWGVYGRSSAFHLCINPDLAIDPLSFAPERLSRQELQAKPPELLRKFKLAMLVNGVDLSGWPGGLLSIAHDDADIEAFDASLDMLKQEGLI